MNRIKGFLAVLPAWLLTGITVAVILWLTLAPDPLGDDAPHLFPGSDKVAHAIMFGYLTVMVLLDRQRTSGWRRLRARFVWSCAIGAAIFGILIEFMQLAMAMGRGFELADMAADCAGAAICALLWLRCQRYWSSKN